MITGIVWLFTGIIAGWIASSSINVLKNSDANPPQPPASPDKATLEQLAEAQCQLASSKRQIAFLWMRLGQMARGDYRIDQVD
jgi:hypothetical protein